MLDAFVGNDRWDPQPVIAASTTMAPVAGFFSSVSIDDQVVSELFAQQAGQLKRAVQLMVDDPHEAEEIVQEAFARFLTSRRRMRHIDQAPAYLRSTAFNLARSALRKRGSARRKAPLVEQDSVEMMHAGAQHSPEAEYDSRVSRDVVLRNLKLLPIRQQECLVLKFFVALPEKEIAETLGISNGSVKTHTSRGLAKLAQLMGSET